MKKLTLNSSEAFTLLSALIGEKIHIEDLETLTKREKRNTVSIIENLYRRIFYLFPSNKKYLNLEDIGI